jgi:hypothetical protein
LHEPQGVAYLAGAHRLFVTNGASGDMQAFAEGKAPAVARAEGLDADDLFYDGQRRQLYAVCGEGVVDVIRQRDAHRYEIAQRVQTSSGARTGLFVPQLAALFVAVPSRGGSSAEIRVYRVE